MSYIELKNLPEFGKCILEFWFRIPGSTVAGSGIGDETDYPELDDVIPLVVFGGARQQQEFKYDVNKPVITTSPNIGLDGGGHFTIIDGKWIMTGQTTSAGAKHYLDPAYIGVDKNGKLVFNLQFDKMPEVSNWNFNPKGASVSVEEPLVDWPDGMEIFHWAPTGATEISVESLMHGKPDSYNFTVSLEATPKKDQWHHVLLSFDLGDAKVTSVKSPDVGVFSKTVQKYSKLWAVVDDVPVKILDNTLTLIGQPDDGAILSTAQWLIGAIPWPDFYTVRFTNTGFNRPIDPISHLPFGFPNTAAEGYTFFPGPASYTSSPTISAGTLGIPASSRFIKSVRHVETAKFQMWIGSSRDVRGKDTRRLFITDEGKPNLKSKDVVDALGEPQVELPRSGNWIRGKNTGSLGGENGENFTPTGKIKSYKPDPSLHGKQGDPQ